MITFFNNNNDTTLFRVQLSGLDEIFYPLRNSDTDLDEEKRYQSVLRTYPMENINKIIDFFKNNIVFGRFIYPEEKIDYPGLSRQIEFLRNKNEEFQSLTEKMNFEIIFSLFRIAMFGMKNFPHWYNAFLISNPVWFITSERLVIEEISDENIERSRNYKQRIIVLERVITQFSRELHRMKRQKIEGSTEIARSQNITFPKRIIEALKELEIPPDIMIQKDLNDVRLKEDFLIKAGLGTKEQAKISEISSHDLKNPNVAKAISLWIKDIKQIQGQFDTLLESIILFGKILNERLNDKKIIFGGNFGFIFINNMKEALEGSQLSSGEQQLVVMIYDMIFKIPDNALVLIDEPELSLHSFWQNAFIDDIIAIGKNKRFILATHSESIIFGRIDLLRHLGKEAMIPSEFKR